MLDVDTFLTALYVIVDDFCQSNRLKKRPDPKTSLSESEVWYEPPFPDNAHSQLLTLRTFMASNSTGGRYPRLECNLFSL